MVGDYKVHKLWNFHRLASRANARATPLVPIMKPIFPSSSGARPALPMGVAPEAIVEFF
jgi:hypothetical protein